MSPACGRGRRNLYTTFRSDRRVHLFLTTVCTMRCVYCYATGGERLPVGLLGPGPVAHALGAALAPRALRGGPRLSAVLNAGTVRPDGRARVPDRSGRGAEDPGPSRSAHCAAGGRFGPVGTLALLTRRVDKPAGGSLRPEGTRLRGQHSPTPDPARGGSRRGPGGRIPAGRRPRDHGRAGRWAGRVGSWVVGCPLHGQRRGGGADEVSQELRVSLLRGRVALQSSRRADPPGLGSLGRIPVADGRS